MRIIISRLVWLAMLVSAAACEPAFQVPSAKVVVQWETATEVNTAGFNLYRGENTDGPYAKINTALIPPSGNQLTGGSYRYEDSGVAFGRTYYYELEDVETNGTKTRHEPIVVNVPAGGDWQAVSITGLVMAVLFVIAGYLFHQYRSRLNAQRVEVRHEAT
jgi:hypothetical protein